MANANTLASLQSGTNPGTLKVLSNIGTTETAVSLNPNPVTGTGSGVAVLSLPHPDQFDAGKPFRVRVNGTVLTNVATNAAVSLYLGNDSNLSNNKALVTMAAVPCNSQTSQFSIEATLNWDSVSKVVDGHNTNRLRATTVSGSTTAATNVIQSQLQFVVTGLFSASNAANALTVSEFALETV